MKLALQVLTISFVAAALSLWLIGFPGICGFTGIYGERLAFTSIGLIAAIALVFLPVVGVGAGLIGVLLATIWRFVRTDRSSTAQ